jgi:hypothetical protein
MPLPPIIPVSQQPFGSTYEEHVKRFWKKYLEMPLAVNPLSDTTKCEQSQNPSDPVFYLPSNLGGNTTRNCSASAGKGILIPVIGVAVLPHEVVPPNEGQRQVADGDQDSVTFMQLKISIESDQVVLNREKLDDYRIRTAVNANIPQGGLFGAPPGLSNCEIDGRYVIAGPIVAGTYTIEFSGRLNCPGKNCLVKERNFSTDNTVILEVT